MKIKEDTNIPAQNFWADDQGNPIAEPADHLLKRRVSVVDDSYVFQPGENDISSIVNWESIPVVVDGVTVKVTVEKDSIYRKSEIKTLFIAKGVDEDARWSACSDDEKDVVAACYLVSTAKRLERYTAQQDFDNFVLLGHVSISSRSSRIDAVQIAIGQALLDQADRADMWTSTQLMTDAYINAGDTGNSSLQAWMNNTGDFVSNGFAQKSYFSQGLLDSFNNIVVDGNY